MTHTRCSLALLCGALSITAAFAQTASSDWPHRPIRLVVPNAPGGGSDTVARALSERLSPSLGQVLVVDNRGGAGGRQAAEFVAKSAADGYTLLLGTAATLITSRALYGKLPYDPVKSFTPVALLAKASYMLVIHPSLPAQNVRQLIAIARSRPDMLSYASTGPGSPSHLAGELFRTMAGIKLIHVPYKGSAPGTLAVMQGEASMMFSNLVAALPHLPSGRFRALGVSSLTRSALAPQIPTVAESGLPGYEVLQYYSLVAPSGTPEPIIHRLGDEITRRFATAETKRQLAAEGTEVSVASPETLAEIHTREIARWSALITRLGITQD